MNFFFKFLFIITFLNSKAFTFTLIDKDSKFPTSSIKLEFVNDSCQSISLAKLKDYTKKAVNKFWNRVGSSAIALQIGSERNINGSAITSFSGLITLAKKNTILVSCLENLGSFVDDGGDNILGVGSIYCASKKNCVGALAINGRSTSAIKNESSTQIIATIAHELGHAIGIGHSSFKHNLMYYSIGAKKQEFLGQDDIDATTYLYPHSKEVQGLMGSCGTIHLQNKNHFTNPDQLTFKFILQIIFGFFTGFILLVASKYLKSRFVAKV
jgi:hypothetical protein